MLNQYLTYPVKVDCGIGPKTLKGLEDVLNKGIDISLLCNSYNDLREKYYYAIVSNNPSQKKFINGWLRRLNSVRKFVSK